MEPKKRSFLIASLSAAIGGALGAVCGSNNWVVVALVSAFFAVLAVWAINGMIK